MNIFLDDDDDDENSEVNRLIELFQATDDTLLKEEKQKREVKKKVKQVAWNTNWASGWGKQHDADMDLLFGKYGLPQQVL